MCILMDHPMIDPLTPTFQVKVYYVVSLGISYHLHFLHEGYHLNRIISWDIGAVMTVLVVVTVSLIETRSHSWKVEFGTNISIMMGLAVHVWPCSLSRRVWTGPLPRFYVVRHLAYITER